MPKNCTQNHHDCCNRSTVVLVYIYWLGEYVLWNHCPREMFYVPLTCIFWMISCSTSSNTISSPNKVLWQLLPRLGVARLVSIVLRRSDIWAQTNSGPRFYDIKFWKTKFQTFPFPRTQPFYISHFRTHSSHWYTVYYIPQQFLTNFPQNISPFTTNSLGSTKFKFNDAMKMPLTAQWNICVCL